MEPGHLRTIRALNPFSRIPQYCDIWRDRRVCLESVGGGVAGIEFLWARQRKEKLDGRGISARFQEGDELAKRLYDNSALIVSHAVVGMGRVFKLLSQPNKTAIVCHGGVFEVPQYRDRVGEILEQNLGHKPVMLFTSDFSDNACLDGAGIAALSF